MRNIAIAFLLLCVAPLHAQQVGAPAPFKQGLKVSNLPTPQNATHEIWTVYDGSSGSDCSVGGGTYQVVCWSNGTVWIAYGGTATPASIGALGPVILVAQGANGFVCDGVTDDTASLNHQLTEYAATGARFHTPAGTTCLFNSAEITFPNDGGSSPAPKQPTWLIEGDGESGNYTNGATLIPTSGSIWLLNYNAADAKLATIGSGYLEIYGMTFRDSGTDCAPFLKTINTTLHIHDNEFMGSKAGASACTDGLVLGGTTSTIGGNISTSAFQGYHTVIRDNYFANTKRIVLGQAAANNVQIVDNTVDPSGGYATGGAVEFKGVSGSDDTGNVIEGNLLEVVNYEYGVNFVAYSEGNYVAGNGCWDQGSVHVACVNFADNTTQYNTVISGWFDNAKLGFQEADSSNTFLTASQSQPSYFSQPSVFSNTLQQTHFSGSNLLTFDMLNTTTSDEAFQVLVPSTTNLTWQFNWKPAGGTTESPFQLYRASSSTLRAYFGDATADTTVFVSTPAAADMKFGSNHSGNVGWLCGGTLICNTYANASGQLANNLAVGTAPFVITSTTPVAHLTTVPTTYNAAGTQQTAVHIVEDTCTLGTSCAVTLTGSAAFTSSTSYTCTANDEAGIFAVGISQISGSAVTFTGNSTDPIRFICIGN